MNQGLKRVDREMQPLVAREVGWWTWKRVLAAAIIIMILLEIGTYAFNWTWTGFKGNDTVWAYLQLLLLPISLAAVPIWFMAEESKQRVWLAQLKIAIVIIAAILLILLIGSYAFDWKWTGFKANGNLWDWLSLFLVPIIVAVLPIWYSLRQGEMSKGTSEKHPQTPQPPAPVPQQAPVPAIEEQQSWPPPSPVQPPHQVRPAPQE